MREERVPSHHATNPGTLTTSHTMDASQTRDKEKEDSKNRQEERWKYFKMDTIKEMREKDDDTRW